MAEITRIKRVLDHLPQPEKERIIRTVFGELLANPFLTDDERRHLEMRKQELLAEEELEKAA